MLRDAADHMKLMARHTRDLAKMQSKRGNAKPLAHPRLAALLKTMDIEAPGDDAQHTPEAESAGEDASLAGSSPGVC